MNNKIIMGVSVVLIGAAFYGGMLFGKSSTSNVQNVNRRFQGQGGNFNMQGANGGQFRQGAGNASGEVLSVSDKSFVVKLRDGGSKIVFFSSSTAFRKFVDGSVDNITAGINVSVNGQANSDGSVTAQIVQIRDASSTPFGPGPAGSMPRFQQ